MTCEARPRRRTPPAAHAKILAALAVAVAVTARSASAQPNLPPPPPPPIGGATDVPSLPPPPEPQSTPGRAPAARRTAPTPAPPPPYRANPASRRTDGVVYVEPETHPVAVTLDPLGLLWGRLSGNVEVQIMPHHSVIVSANTLLYDEDRGGPNNLVSEGLGFASRASRGFGVEVGYHYWWDWARALRGPFCGPSLLLGATSVAAVGDPTHVQAYWGLALDGGWQEVFAGGFTAGAGGGLELVRMSGTTAVVPRFLIQLGWSF